MLIILQPPPYFHPQPQTFYPTSNPNPHLAKIVPRPRTRIHARLPKTCAHLLPPTPERTPATGLKAPYAPRSSNTHSPGRKVLTDSMPWARIRLCNIADLADEICLRGAISKTKGFMSILARRPIPAIHDPNTNTTLAKSALIAEYLDSAYPDTPKLFPPGTRPLQYAFIDVFMSHLDALWQFVEQT
ncbi:hypothetical protein H0H81_005112 [Sphagnurus paluster]|uniref:GST N-terminal domain-containing protein n=1 Tax=Sphagnurus paluster TaxID=117069 RepID=A0A9P7FLF3_9AGAR|nr:hypothetical protein H0H81_005112 [Sphagnurus paluster]